MPQVGNQNFPYNSSGLASAKKKAKKTGKPLKMMAKKLFARKKKMMMGKDEMMM